MLQSCPIGVSLPFEAREGATWTGGTCCRQGKQESLFNKQAEDPLEHVESVLNVSLLG
jgi:hypothetical protein